MKIAPLFPAAVLALSVAWAPVWAQPGKKGDFEFSGKVLYRYKDEQGVQVLDDLVPPRYVADGYEVLSLSGRVLKVVPPQLSGEELAEQQRRKAQREEDLKLLKRYNSVADIESARSRKLAVVNQDMAIMRSNITSLHRQVEQEETAAARTQRNGREVPPELLARIADLKKEIGVLKERLSRREAEAERLNKEFDHAARRYAEIAP
ncbi:hypothetical protein [Microbulbifer rhizosphaerae]|uniref:Putative nucleic acid-binding Zn-ribbon protein n=1 Tax=Microbulbifer rhizosphaerae TaxID=1562603 RepID=A0A7W4Z9A9_9GAMM|nr:hypothetical protein [Microbulbifer rhizosphaerae]MBB3061633.1 putative nucleic acid-binding Zn-ribbon protein [Microbulbifer rhizosphaerae]